MSIRLYVKLPKIEIEKESLEKMFTDFEPSFTSKIIKERKNGKCRGFGFITVTDDEAADVFISKYNEQILIYEDQPIKDEDGSDFKLFVEKALPRTKPENSENSEVKDKPEIKNKSENKGKPQLGDKKIGGK